MEEALHRSVTVIIAGAAHGGRRADRRQMVDIGTSPVLRSKIRVADQAGRWSLPLGCHHQRCERQLGVHVVARRLAEDLAGCQIGHCGQIQPVLAGSDLGDIGQPNPVGRSCHKALSQQARRDRQIVAAVGGAGP